MITLRPYVPPTFLLPMGAVYKTRQIRKRGFPENLRNWRFITLTMDRSQYPDPEQAYDIGCRHLREFIYRLRRYYKFLRYAWKLEFHSPDPVTGHVYAHWHLLIDYKRPIDKDRLSAIWGKGRTNVKGIRENGFEYVFKYVSKAVDDVPDWVTSLKAIRLFQTSRNFYSGNDADAKELEASPRQVVETTDDDTQNDSVSRYDETIGERINRWSRSVVTRSISEDGIHYRHRVHQLIESSWHDLLLETCLKSFAENTPAENVKLDQHKIEVSCLRHLPSRLFLFNLAHT